MIFYHAKKIPLNIRKFCHSFYKIGRMWYAASHKYPHGIGLTKKEAIKNLIKWKTTRDNF